MMLRCVDDVVVDPDVKSLLVEFLPSRIALVNDLRLAVAQQNEHSAVRSICHKLRGSFCLYGFEYMGELCRTLMEGYAYMTPEAATRVVAAIEYELELIGKAMHR